MRGYNHQADATNSNPRDSFLAKEIEEYTIKDCEDFLAKYSNDLDADKVRKKLEQLRILNMDSFNNSSTIGTALVFLALFIVCIAGLNGENGSFFYWCGTNLCHGSLED